VLRRRGTAHFQSGRPARVTVAGGRCPSSTSNMVKRCKNLHHILRIIHTCEKQVCTEPMGGFLFFTRPSCCKVATPLSRSQTFRKCVKNSPPTMYLKQLNIRDNTTLTRQWLSDHKCDLVLLNVMFGVFHVLSTDKKIWVMCDNPPTFSYWNLKQSLATYQWRFITKLWIWFHHGEATTLDPQPGNSKTM